MSIISCLYSTFLTGLHLVSRISSHNSRSLFSYPVVVQPCLISLGICLLTRLWIVTRVSSSSSAVRVEQVTMVTNVNTIITILMKINNVLDEWLWDFPPTNQSCFFLHHQHQTGRETTDNYDQKQYRHFWGALWFPTSIVNCCNFAEMLVIAMQTDWIHHFLVLF